jgi:YVTN family beta-propeller protein
MRRHWARVTIGALLLALTLLVGCRQPASPATPTPTSWLGALPSADLSERPAAATAYALATQRASLATPAAPGSDATTPTVALDAMPTSAPTRPEEALFSRVLRVSDLPGQGRDPSALAVLGDTLYVACRDTGNVAIIRNNKVVSFLTVGERPSALVADPARQRVIVLIEGDGSLAIIEQGAVTQSWQMDQALSRLALVGDELWAASAAGDTLFGLSAETGQLVGEVALGQNQYASRLLASPDGAMLFVQTYGQLYAVDLVARRISAQTELESAYDMALSPDGQRLYVLRYDPAAEETVIQVYNPRDLEPRQRAALPSDVTALVASPLDGRLFAFHHGRGEAIALDGATLKELGRSVVGWHPQHAALSADGRTLYVANTPAQSITAVDPATLHVTSVIPLAPVLTGLAVDPISARVYVAAASEGLVRVYDAEGQPVGAWEAGLYPAAVQAVAGAGQVAVLDQPAALLRLLDQSGATLAAHATGANPQGLTVDEFEQRLYAGNLALSLKDNASRTLQATTYTDQATAPVKTVLDTRRGLLYGIVSNGVPGSNGGYVVQRLDEVGATPAAWSRLSMIAAAYDEEFDRFYSLWTRMGSNGLLISDAETGAPLYDVRFDRPATALALDPATRQLWVALSGAYAADGASKLACYDTANVAQKAVLPLPAPVEALAVDVRHARLYLASSATGAVYALDEAVAGLSSLYVPIPSVTPMATAEAAPTATPTPRPVVAANATPAPAPTCVGTVHGSLRAAWEYAGGDDGIGCAYLDASEGDWAIQPYEGGLMLWRSGVSFIYVLANDGSLRQVDDTWREGMAVESCTLDVPAERMLPIRGFGAIWCSDPDIRLKLGWATDDEQGFRPLYQVFWRGVMVRLPDGRILALYDDGHWIVANP